MSATDPLSRLLAERGRLLADGAIGTNLFAMGLETGAAPELWNLECPQRVEALHRSFVAAGSDLILTNTFGANRYRLALHGAAGRVAEVNAAAARIARQVADAAPRRVLVGGSMGPTGEVLEPLGSLTAAEARAAFAEQAEALAGAGVDVLWIETLSSREELEAALAGAAGSGLAVVCTLSFDTHGRTMMGISPGEFAALCHAATPPPRAFGANCGVGPAECVAGLLGLRAVAAGDLIVAKANCGLPEWSDGGVRYSGTPELMADYARLAADAGARIIGGCCGTTAEHVAAMRAALDAHRPGPPPTLEDLEARLGAISEGARGVAGGQRRRRPPRTRRRGVGPPR